MRGQSGRSRAHGLQCGQPGACLCLLLAAACTDLRPPTDTRVCPDFRATVAPALQFECAPCHSARDAQGGYRVDGYGQLLEPGFSGQRPVDASDDDALLLRAARGENAHPARASEQTIALLERWVVDCELSTISGIAVHPRGWLNAESPEFHGEALRRSGWNVTACAECHGDPTSSRAGPTGSSCYDCHLQGPFACDVCHGTGPLGHPPPAHGGGDAITNPGVGAHAVHVEGGPILGQPVACGECHIVPERWDDPGHVLGADGSIDLPPAEVVFGPIAAGSLEGFESARVGPPQWDRPSQTCSNVACHGGALPSAGSPPPVWTELDAGASGCALCHGNPPASTAHPTPMTEADCVTCHGRVVDAAGTLVDASLHLDNRVSLGDDSETCAACHGRDPETGVPPPGVDGELSADVPTVGAHASHAGGPPYMGAFPCRVCHAMPTGEDFYAAVSAPGHLTSLADGAEVFRDADGELLSALLPSADGTGPLVAAEGRVQGELMTPGTGAAALYDPVTTACAVYCHGDGSVFAGDASPGRILGPRWIDSGNTVTCDGCHGIPPTGHEPALLSECATCHAASITSAAQFVIGADGLSLHINGRVEVNP